MQKYEPSIEQMNSDYQKMNNEKLPINIIDIISLFIKAVDEAYEKGLNDKQLTKKDYIFPVTEVKTA